MKKILKFSVQNSELVQDARSARSLRDELDVLREKVGIFHWPICLFLRLIILREEASNFTLNIEVL